MKTRYIAGLFAMAALGGPSAASANVMVPITFVTPDLGAAVPPQVVSVPPGPGGAPSQIDLTIGLSLSLTSIEIENTIITDTFTGDVSVPASFGAAETSALANLGSVMARVDLGTVMLGAGDGTIDFDPSDTSTISLQPPAIPAVVENSVTSSLFPGESDFAALEDLLGGAAFVLGLFDAGGNITGTGLSTRLTGSAEGTVLIDYVFAPDQEPPPTPGPVPAPGSLALFGVGLLGLRAIRRRQ